MTKAEFLYQIALIVHGQGINGIGNDLSSKAYCTRTVREAAIIQAVDPENPRTADYALADTETLDKLFTDEDYTEIEYIYTYHPAIPDVGGKKYIAQMFCMGLLSGENRKRFLAEAEEAQRKEETTRKLRAQITELQRSLGAAQRKLHDLEIELENIA